MAILIGYPAAASADQLVLVCRSTVLRTQSNGGTGYGDSYKVYVDTTAKTEHTDQSTPFSVAIDRQAIAGRHQIAANVSAYTRIDRTTGDYELRQCLDSQCVQPPPSWIVTDKGHCEKGEQRF